MPKVRIRSFSLVVAAAAMVLLACGEEVGDRPRGGSFGVPTETVTSGALCTPARASEDLAPRADLMGVGTAGPGGAEVVYTSDLFVRFNAICGGCHVEASSGGRKIDEATFAAVFDASWLAPIKSDDPTKVMPPPPNGKPFSERQGNDPVLSLVAYLEDWMAAGRPSDLFTRGGAGDPGQGNPQSSYGFAPDVGTGFTNLGHCVPKAAIFATSTSGVMESKDVFFATAEALPPTLAETDLTTFDARDLAATGVLAFVPQYPLWSAGSGKIRHIRIPRGQTIRFDKEKQSFAIPANTRFYKTFLRKVIDRAGRVSNRKMETRVIVSRPDQTLPDGTVVETALFGTYVWSEDETTATLANLPYRDGTAFADQVRTYITDELRYQNIADTIPPGANYAGRLAAALARETDLEHHYAIPGRIRCVQCHIGSPTHDFVLGFFPLQIRRRPDGTGGAYEPTGEDELSQLQRFLDYGLISGMSSPEEVLTLEESQGARKARTSAELDAQAYMVGNCAHCHNPRGFPSVTKPELARALDLLPSAEGGVFEMPLDRMSPIRARGANGDVPIPYITPSLYDFPVADEQLNRMDDGQPVFPGLEGGKSTWSPKYSPDYTCEADNPFSRSYCGNRRTGPSFVYAPWRSLIYRNVDSPFSYFDDYVPFPHMPMNTPGFDCRAPRIMGDWMVGLPAVRLYPAIPEANLPRVVDRNPNRIGMYYDKSPQPYRGVRPEDPEYADALLQARGRLAQYHASVRYSYCEEVLSPDIYDPVEPVTPGGYRPDPDRYLFGSGSTPPLDPRRPTEYVQPAIGVPYHSHFFPYDPTDPPPPWSPRRPEWKAILVDREPDLWIPAGEATLREEVRRDRRVLVEAINEASLTDALRDYATREIPAALWQTKPECEQKLATQPKVSDIPEAARPTWMRRANVAADARVYLAPPGATLYRHICVNCHGTKADGKGLQADALGASSEGEARPANFREGLFGPSDRPGGNLAALFGAIDMQGGLLWGPRYVAWMALGGTLKRIPRDIVHQVEVTKVFGEPRQNLHFLPGVGEASANMLNLAMGLCSVVLPDPTGHYYLENQAFVGGLEPAAYPPFEAPNTPFISANGDREMWLALCTRFSPQLVRVYEVVPGPRIDVNLTAIVEAEGYPPDAPVLDHEKIVRTGVRSDNLYPACLSAPTDPALAEWLADKPIRTRTKMPDCPAGLLDSAEVLWSARFTTAEMYDNVKRWELRGAIATGMAVFSYLREGAQRTLPPYFNECHLLQ